MTPSLALQKTLRSRLTADPAVTALVPPNNVFDRHGLPERFPCVMIGEGQEVAADDITGRYFRTFATLHLWDDSAGLTGVKEMAGAIRRAVRERPWPVEGCFCHALTVQDARFLRDPKEDAVSHGVVTIEALIEELN